MNTTYEEEQQLFRSVPPLAIIINVLQLLELPTEFPANFQRNQIQLNYSDEAVAIIEPYYKPAKARLYLDYTDQKRWCTILRQLLTLHGWVLMSKEITRDKRKLTIYSIERSLTEKLLQPIQLDFT